jgi:hypothetical protein
LQGGGGFLNPILNRETQRKGKVILMAGERSERPILQSRNPDNDEAAD